jgi:zinc D-Ala-D-Ala carboxypeptidase
MPIKRKHYSGSATHYFKPIAGLMFSLMCGAAKRDGVNITLTDSYRDYATQVRLRAEWCAQNKCYMAATPGTSNHGWGCAIDVANGRDWMKHHGERRVDLASVGAPEQSVGARL